MKFHHIGCAVKNIVSDRDKISKLFNASATEIVFDPLQNAELCMLRLPDGSRIELISGEVVASFVQKRITYYHVCYSVSDIESAIDELKAKGSLLVSGPKPAILFDDKLVAFLMTPIGLLELVDI